MDIPVTETHLWKERQRLFAHLKAHLETFAVENKFRAKGLHMLNMDMGIVGDFCWNVIIDENTDEW